MKLTTTNTYSKGFCVYYVFVYLVVFNIYGLKLYLRTVGGEIEKNFK